MGVTSPPLPRVPDFGVHGVIEKPETQEEQEERRLKTRALLKQCYVRWLRRVPDNNLRTFLDRGAEWGLTRAERAPLWLAEFDKRTLLRPAAGVNGVKQNELLRAAGI